LRQVQNKSRNRMTAQNDANRVNQRLRIFKAQRSPLNKRILEIFPNESLFDRFTRRTRHAGLSSGPHIYVKNCRLGMSFMARFMTARLR
jgi:hypothetical protein